VSPKSFLGSKQTTNIGIDYNARKTLEKFSACPTCSKT